MKKILLFFFGLPILFTSCIQDAPLNPEADILSFHFPDGCQRIKNVEIYNNYIVAYPKKDVSLQDSAFRLTVTSNAVWERIDKYPANDTLFYIKVTSEDKTHSKLYSVIQVEDFPEMFDFENWVKFSSAYQYENPKQLSLQWYSSNNGIAIAWLTPGKPAGEYPVRKTNDCVSGNWAVELKTMVGPGNILNGKNIPCVAGSLFLGGFDVLTGLTDPLKSTKFGVPFNSGKPVKLTGYYIWQEGTEDFINADGSRTPGKRDTCAIYSLIYKTDDNVQYLYGDNIGTSPNVIARAEVKPSEMIQGNTFVPFEVYFDYASYTTPFIPEELENNEYKIIIVFSSGNRGDYYEGRPGSRLVVDNVKLHYDVLNR